MNKPPDRVIPGWPSPVRAFSTTRAGGVSAPPFDTFNLGEHAGDDPEAVAENRRRLRTMLPADPAWLVQEHGRRVIHLRDWHPGVRADGAWTDVPGPVAVVLTADCLPVLLADPEAGVVAAVHAGWRGLAAGILDAAVAALPVVPGRLRAWIGPGIGADAYEVGPEVPGAFRGLPGDPAEAFTPGRDDRFQADLKNAARRMLHAAGVESVTDAKLCTAAAPERFFSHRRDRRTGRMATLIWLEG